MKISGGRDYRKM